MLRINPATPLDESGMRELPPFEQWVRAERAIWAHRPELTVSVDAVFATLQATGTISPRLFELLRIRIGMHNQCRACLTVRYAPDVVDENLVCALEFPDDSPDLTPGERAALRFADLYASDHLAIDNATFEGLREHFDEGELVELSVICALFIGIGRNAAVWRVYDEYPMAEWPPAGEEFLPWASGATIDADFSDGRRPPAEVA
jgi:alkylhydroperoxidase family enzyme